MAEGARLESVFTRKGNVGSNPTLSATQSKLQRNNLAFAAKYATHARISQYFVRKADWREWTARDRMASLCRTFSGGASAVRFQGGHEANAMRSQTDDAAKGDLTW